jgi:hypothetical protein
MYLRMLWTCSGICSHSSEAAESETNGSDMLRFIMRWHVMLHYILSAYPAADVRTVPIYEFRVNLLTIVEIP